MVSDKTDHNLDAPVEKKTTKTTEAASEASNGMERLIRSAKAITSEIKDGIRRSGITDAFGKLHLDGSEKQNYIDGRDYINKVHPDPQVSPLENPSHEMAKSPSLKEKDLHQLELDPRTGKLIDRDPKDSWPDNHGGRGLEWRHEKHQHPSEHTHTAREGHRWPSVHDPRVDIPADKIDRGYDHLDQGNRRPEQLQEENPDRIEGMVEKVLDKVTDKIVEKVVEQIAEKMTEMMVKAIAKELVNMFRELGIQIPENILEFPMGAGGRRRGTGDAPIPHGQDTNNSSDTPSNRDIVSDGKGNENILVEFGDGRKFEVGEDGNMTLYGKHGEKIDLGKGTITEDSDGNVIVENKADNTKMILRPDGTVTGQAHGMSVDGSDVHTPDGKETRHLEPGDATHAGGIWKGRSRSEVHEPPKEKPEVEEGSEQPSEGLGLKEIVEKLDKFTDEIKKLLPKELGDLLDDFEKVLKSISGIKDVDTHLEPGKKKAGIDVTRDQGEDINFSMDVPNTNGHVKITGLHLDPNLKFHLGWDKDGLKLELEGAKVKVNAFGLESEIPIKGIHLGRDQNGHLAIMAKIENPLPIGDPEMEVPVFSL